MYSGNQTCAPIRPQVLQAAQLQRADTTAAGVRTAARLAAMEAEHAARGELAASALAALQARRGCKKPFQMAGPKELCGPAGSEQRCNSGMTTGRMLRQDVPFLSVSRH